MSNRRLSAAEREDLADVRTVLRTALHNLDAVIADADESAQALANAQEQVAQAATTLKRLRKG
jgi:hypothetical protein